jgi:hypothetical protein
VLEKWSLLCSPFLRFCIFLVDPAGPSGERNNDTPSEISNVMVWGDYPVIYERTINMLPWGISSTLWMRLVHCSGHFFLGWRLTFRWLYIFLFITKSKRNPTWNCCYGIIHKNRTFKNIQTKNAWLMTVTICSISIYLYISRVCVCAYWEKKRHRKACRCRSPRVCRAEGSGKRATLTRQRAQTRWTKISILKIHKKITDHGNTMGLFHAYKSNDDLSVVWSILPAKVVYSRNLRFEKIFKCQ